MSIHYRIRYRDVDCIASTLTGVACKMRELCSDNEPHIAIDNNTRAIILGPFDTCGLSVERIDVDLASSRPPPPDSRKLAFELALADVAAEIMSARAAWPAFNSAHEGYAVALEEVDDLWEHVKRKPKDRDLDAMRHEAVQAAAMFTAFAAECCGEKTGRA